MDVPLSKFDVEVLECLSPTEWKTLGELSEEIGTRRKAEGRRKLAVWIFALLFRDREFADALVLEANIGSLSISCEKFESLGWVEFRWRQEAPEKTAKRGGYRLGERRLTESGHRIRAALPRTADDAQGHVIPQHS